MPEWIINGFNEYLQKKSCTYNSSIFCVTSPHTSYKCVPVLHNETFLIKLVSLITQHRTHSTVSVAWTHVLGFFFFCAYFSVLFCDGRPYHTVVCSQRHVENISWKYREETRLMIECVCRILKKMEYRWIYVLRSYTTNEITFIESNLCMLCLLDCASS